MGRWNCTTLLRQSNNTHPLVQPLPSQDLPGSMGILGVMLPQPTTKRQGSQDGPAFLLTNQWSSCWRRDQG
jgi:hypothetical protein